MTTDVMQRLFFSTARERYSIFKRQEAIRSHRTFLSDGETYQFNGLTNDAIFGTFRFCNVFREDDKVTRWFAENIRSQMKTETQHLRAAVAFRWFNLPATGELLLPWLKGEETIGDAEARVTLRQRIPATILNAAYMIKSPPGMSKTQGIFQCLRTVEQALEDTGRIIKHQNTLQHAVAEISFWPYLGPFMAYQSVCDLRFTPLLQDAADVNYWTSPGPGSARGAGRLFHNEPKAYNYNSARDRDVLLEKMRYLLHLSREPTMWHKHWPAWELSTVQHWLCEFDKYVRAQEGTAPKQRYRSAS